ncbi:tripartite motif-containing protein 26-like [Ochotona princeps]|uniref:tripartite motif-containing protein 26-like n=1 Tax=Ochotona princeps TaxID=9978 RepID=UPI0027152740|nr:tripartite motif-containing protein 26-like [Ochotona princeps]XP_058522262.1 tripartite motif-containing protein 26-like [Ochotona princeps]XP_058522268.1 tripartite motif-containing protein 26-like [Ochotona princeps]XP_058522273.1 tripartite motif-containing protein 26-like [Ochotona princeps]XP_058522283.1 tripartite motif-containing protein 26-like [Ochotona princeps]XP_058522290.1 tripartite motif-containing protein 26-like [Ochotona princeps]
MAAASLLRNLEDEVLCSICLDFLKDPVTINCGHVFCYLCIIKVCESSKQSLHCSLCKIAFKKENIHHVWQMASLVENIWRMKIDEEQRTREERPPEQRAEKLCGRHLELHYYCKDDRQILCVLCRESREHQHHAAILLEKAAQPFRGKILSHLKVLKGERDRIQNFQSTGQDEIQALLTTFQNHKQDIATVFEQGHQFLREWEQYLLEWLVRLEQELTEGRDSRVTKGSEEVVRLGTLISELEKAARQPALELLQDPSDILSRYPRKKFWIEKPISPAIKKQAEEFSDKLLSLEKGLRGFHGKLMRDLEYKTMRIVLNSQTASGYLSVSPNGRSMIFTGSWMNKYQQGQRFDPEPAVLGSSGFTWGKVYWEVKVDRIWWGAEEEEEAVRCRGGVRGMFSSSCFSGFLGISEGYGAPGYRNEHEELEEEEWSQGNGIWLKFCIVGVARESVVRRGFLNFSPEEGFWTLQLSSAGVSVYAGSDPFQILSYCPRQIGVALDYDGGKVTFTNARTQEVIYEFSTSFSGKIFPFLWLNCMRSRLTLRP